MTVPGISGFSIELPPYRVPLADWCSWTGANPHKTLAVVGESFRMPGPQQNAYTLAAGAVLKLLEQYAIDPDEVGFLALGTESSTDNAAGAIIVKGMVDQALIERGDRPLSRRCEVPEVKHACLGGIYALKSALRYVASDGHDRKAIVIASDIAEYERGSTGEPTQGAGAVAMLVEASPKLFSVDLREATSASSYRHLDFRKPVARFDQPGYSAQTKRRHDFPVFNGKYSNACYLDEVLAGVRSLMGRSSDGPLAALERFEQVFLHRPYHHLPRSAWGLSWVAAIALDPVAEDQLRDLCDDAGVDVDGVRAELTASDHQVFEQALQGELGGEVFPLLTRIERAFRKTDAYAAAVAARLSLGADRTRHLGNLYTASLPAWLAAAAFEAAEQDADISGQTWLGIGYGSGDAAELLPMQVVPGWREAAARINFDASLEGTVDLNEAQYARLHDGAAAEGLPPLRRGFAITDIGKRVGPDVYDVGVESYALVS